MKKILLALVSLALLALSFAALDDITTGNEPDYYGEYAVLAFTALFFVVIIVRHFTKKKDKNVEQQPVQEVQNSEEPKDAQNTQS